MKSGRGKLRRGKVRREGSNPTRERGRITIRGGRVQEKGKRERKLGELTNQLTQTDYFYSAKRLGSVPLGTTSRKVTITNISSLILPSSLPVWSITSKILGQRDKQKQNKKERMRWEKREINRKSESRRMEEREEEDRKCL